MRDSFIFYRSFYEAISDLDDMQQLEIYKAIADFSLNFIEPNLSGVSATIFKLIKPQLKANNKRYMNGSKPKNKQDRSETEAKTKQDDSETEANKNKNKNKNKNENKNENKNNTDPLFVEYKKQNENASERELSLAMDFINYRKSIKDKIKTLLPIKMYIKELKNLHKLGYVVNDCIEKMKENEWKTVKVEYIHKPTNNSSQSKIDYTDTMI